MANRAYRHQLQPPLARVSVHFVSCRVHISTLRPGPLHMCPPTPTLTHTLAHIHTPNPEDMPFSADLDELRTVVATLKLGMDFCRRLGAGVALLRQLLAYPAAEVVQETIVLLTFCWWV